MSAQGTLAGLCWQQYANTLQLALQLSLLHETRSFMLTDCCVPLYRLLLVAWPSRGAGECGSRIVSVTVCVWMTKRLQPGGHPVTIYFLYISTCTHQLCFCNSLCACADSAWHASLQCSYHIYGNLLLLLLPAGSTMQSAVQEAVQEDKDAPLVAFAATHGVGMFDVPVYWEGEGSICMSALDFAILHDAINVVRWLLQHGVQASALRRRGFSPLSWALYRAAMSQQHNAMAQLLLSYWPAEAMPSRLAFTGKQVPAVGWGAGQQQQEQSLNAFLQRLSADVRHRMDLNVKGWFSVPVAGQYAGVDPAPPVKGFWVEALHMLLLAIMALLFWQKFWQATAFLRVGTS